MTVRETAKHQLNGGATDWVIRGFVLLALGWFINELTYMRHRIAVLEDKAQVVASSRFTNAEGDEIRRDQLSLERLLQTKIDAKEAEENVRLIRMENLEWQNRIESRLRAVETNEGAQRFGNNTDR